MILFVKSSLSSLIVQLIKFACGIVITAVSNQYYVWVIFISEFHPFRLPHKAEYLSSLADLSCAFYNERFSVSTFFPLVQAFNCITIHYDTSKMTVCIYYNTYLQKMQGKSGSYQHFLQRILSDDRQFLSLKS